MNHQCNLLFVTFTMAAESKQPPVSFVILSYVFLTTHFDDGGNEIFYDKTWVLESCLETYLSLMNTMAMDTKFPTEC